MRNFDFCANFKKIVIVPIALILIGVILFIAIGLNIGVDFSGGSLVSVQLGAGKYSVDDIRAIAGKYSDNFTVLSAGDNSEVVEIRLGGDDDKVKEAQDKIKSAIMEKYEVDAGVFSVNYVGPVVGQELIKNALLALAIALVLMLLYIWIRFELFSGIAAVVGLFHDVIIMFVFVILFRTQINTPFIAAILTIVGYSINNTIIIFDRIRSNRAALDAKYDSKYVVNKSVKETFGRSVNTTVTTLIALVVLYIVGVESIKTFVLPIIVGLFAGFYSSVFITGPFWTIISNKKTVEKKTTVKL